MGRARQRIAGPILLLHVVLFLSLAALVACREPPAGRTAAPAETATGVIRLLDRLDDAAVDPGVPRTAGGEPLHAFDGGPTPQPAAEQRCIARLRARDTAQLRVRARPLDRAASLVVTTGALGRTFGADERPTDFDRVAPAASRAAPPADADRDGWHSLSLRIPSCAGRRALEVAVAASAGEVEVASLELRLESALERATHAPPIPTLRRAAWRLDARRDEESVPSLLLHPGGRARWRVVVPAHGSLTARLAALADPPAAPVAADLLVDGVVAARFSAPAEDHDGEQWHDVAFDLTASAGRTVALELALDPAATGSLLVGAPLLVGDDPRPPERRPPNLVLLSIDTLRADHVGCYGGDPLHTPVLDRLAAEGTRFARFHAASSWTLPSHATLFSSQEPPRHGADRAERALDPARTPLLAPELAAAGFLTAAFTGGGLVDPAFGFAAGFDRYSVRDPGRTAARDPMAPVEAWIAAHRGQPFFLFVHTYVVHDYAPDAASLARWPPPGPATETRELAKLLDRIGAGERDLLPRLQGLYVAALRQADERVAGRLLAALAANGLDDRTIVSVVSDHGEQWLEHGDLTHAHELWSELVRVPWIVRGPGFDRGVVRDEWVGHLDVAPTLLAALGLPRPEPMRGADVRAADHEAAPQLGAVIGNGGDRAFSVTTASWRLIRRFLPDQEGPLVHLFRIDVDPRESSDVAAAHPDVVASLSRWLDGKLAECAAGSVDAPAAPIDDALRQRLEELGYGAE